MPALAFLAAVGLALIALLFVADATLEPSSPPVVTGDRVDLPKPWHAHSTHPDAMRNLSTAPAPAPDMASDLVRSAMPKAQSAPKDDLAKVKPATRTARAEAPPKKKRVTRTQPPVEDRQNNTGSHFSGVREFGLSGAN
jgi:hypothetical protein